MVTLEDGGEDLIALPPTVTSVTSEVPLVFKDWNAELPGRLCVLRRDPEGHLKTIGACE
jgi:hypothetical protein